jgi:hypothetical protein
VAVPRHVDAALGIEVEALVAVAAVDRDALAARDVADHRVAGQRAAAAREPHQDVALALDQDARGVLPPRHLADELAQHALGLLGLDRPAFLPSSAGSLSSTCCTVILP